MLSYANVNSANMELTPSRIKFNNIDLGGVKNLKISIAWEKSPIKADQLGNTDIDKRVSGIKITIDGEALEIKNKALWEAIQPNSLKVGTNPYSTVFLSKIGESDLNLAKVLVIHPLSLADSDKSEDINVDLATADGISELKYSPTEQQTLKFVFTVYPNTSVSPARFMVIGDPSIGLVNASAATAVFTGTGNGTLTNVAVFGGAGGTETEIVTILAVGIPAVGESNWLVSGSLSGVIGYAALTSTLVNFTSPKIAFKITDGLTDFVIGDKWTVATTGSNYV